MLIHVSIFVDYHSIHGSDITRVKRILFYWFETAFLCSIERVSIMLIKLSWKGFSWAGNVLRGSCWIGVAVKPVMSSAKPEQLTTDMLTVQVLNREQSCVWTIRVIVRLMVLRVNHAGWQPKTGRQRRPTCPKISIQRAKPGGHVSPRWTSPPLELRRSGAETGDGCCLGSFV